MSANYLSDGQREQLFRYGYAIGMIEKQASLPAALAWLPAAWDALKAGGKSLKGLFTVGTGAAEGAANILKTLMIGGVGVGGLGALAYDAVKTDLTREDPKVKLNEKLDKLYRTKSMEADDSAWMKRVRGMRDDLLKGYKKMSTEEYAAKYRELQDALDERKAKI